MTNNYQIIRCKKNAINEKQLQEASILIYESFSEFYNLFTCNQAEVINIISESFFIPNNELSNSKVYIKNKIIRGAISYYPSNDFFRRRMFSLKMLLNLTHNINCLKSKLSDFSKKVPKINIDSFYLARIAVVKESRNEGIGKILLSEFEKQGLMEGYNTFSLHTHIDNCRAISFYQSNGYKIQKEKGDFDYLHLYKEI